MDYSYTLDPFPQETSAHTKLNAYYDHLREGRFATTRCTRCGFVGYPPRPVCPECLSDEFVWEILPDQGEIAAYTVQESGIPYGFERPLVFALVMIGSLRIFTRIVDSPLNSLRIGAGVRVSPIRVPDSPFSSNRVLLAFKTIESASES